MKYDNEIIKVMHQEAIEMHKIGVISDARMREYDEMCLNPKSKKSSSEYNNDKNTVNLEQVSQATA